MSELISGKEALSKVSEGIVQYKCDTDPVHDRWTTITDHFWDQYNLGVFLNEDTTWKFRLKPRTINLNGIELPAPFKPEEGDIYWYITDCERGYGEAVNRVGYRVGIAAWRTEEEIKQVIATLKNIFWS